MCWIHYIALSALIMIVGCDDPTPDYDTFPININTHWGGAVLTATTNEYSLAFPMLIDTATPISVIDSIAINANTMSQPYTGAPEHTLYSTDITLRSACHGNSITACVDETDRALFPNTQVFDLHPCADINGIPCVLGTDHNNLGFGGIFGSNALQLVSTRFLLNKETPQIQFFPYLLGDNTQQCSSNKAVIDMTLSQSSMISVYNHSVDIDPKNIAIFTCMGMNHLDTTTPSGTDFLLILSTGIGTTILSRTAYEKYAAQHNTLPISQLPLTNFHFPSGTVHTHTTTIPTMALINRKTISVSPCEEWRIAATNGTCLSQDTCACPGEETVCETTAAVTLTPTDEIQIAILPDEHRIFQSFYNDPDHNLPQINGILGLAALNNLDFNIDYPNERLVIQCLARSDECIHYPEISNPSGTSLNEKCLNDN